MSLEEGLAFKQISLSFAAFALYTSLESLHVYLCLHSFVKHRQAPIHVQRSRRRYVRVMFIALFFSMATYCFDLALFYISTWNRTPETQSAEFAVWLAFHICIGATHLVANGLLAWRCYVIWTGNPCIGLAPVIPAAASLAVGILNLASSAICVKPKPANVICKNHGLLLHRGLYYLFATIVGATATILICVRLFRTKVRMEKIMGHTTTNSTTTATMRLGGPLIPYNRIIMVLMESALPFTLLGIVTAALTISDIDSAEGVRLFSYRLWTVGSGLTAQVITYRLIAGISLTSSREGDSYVLSRPIDFERSEDSSMSRDLATN
ncbi:hypothetical protein BKA70DRAFT_1435491 [Coprinopsis sp. MPI-PUGE-AT-0042]|nr:hypothetical protein BKA70DRAFT_1435491 [Coprinopsis sp. MPI-PUGE-AT-0042]